MPGESAIGDGDRRESQPPRSPPTDGAIRAAAARQHGVVTLDQLERLGLGARGVQHRAATGRLVRLHRGVYATDDRGRQTRWMAAVLACGAPAVLSHRSAGALHGVVSDRRRGVDVTVQDPTARSKPEIAVHRARSLGDEDVETVDGIPATTLPRTLLDLAAVVDRRTLERAIDRAEQLRTFDLTSLEQVLARAGRGRRGAAALRSLLGELGGSTTTQSRAEERLLRLVRDADLPHPRVNAWIALDDGGGYRPDFLWKRKRLIVEVDGRPYHARRRAFRHDRRRDRRLALAGYETRRYDAAEVVEEPERVLAELRAFLATPSG